MRKLKAEELPTEPGMGGAWPIIDGYVIPDDQYKLYKEGNYNDVAVLIGYNSDEGASFSRERTPEEYIANVRQRFGKFADTLIKAYPAGENHVPRTARNLMRDAAFGWHTWTWARLQSQTGKSNVFLYYFDQHPNLQKDSPRNDLGSPHGQEIPYVFMTLDKDNPRTTETDLKLSDIISSYWTNFAKYGDPNRQGLPRWPAFTRESEQLMYLNADPHASPVPDEKSLHVLDAYFKWRFTQEGRLSAK